MPVFSFGDIYTDVGRFIAMTQVSSTMLYPDDEDNRLMSAASRISFEIGYLENYFEPGSPRYEEAKSSLVQEFDRIGGYTLVARAPAADQYRQQYEKHVSQWLAAGAVLILIWQIVEHHEGLVPSGASINKALDVLSQAKDDPLIPKNRTDIKKAWTRYRSVAHLCAAELWMYRSIEIHTERAAADQATDIEAIFRDCFDQWLGVAEAYQRFATTYQLPNTRAKTLIDSATAWLLPDQRQWEERADYKPGPLQPWQIAVLQEYRAPQDL